MPLSVCYPASVNGVFSNEPYCFSGTTTGELGTEVGVYRPVNRSGSPMLLNAWLAWRLFSVKE